MVKTQAKDWAVEEITRVVQTYGPRAPGSEEEFAAQKDMAKQCEAWADTVEFENFDVARQAFMGFIPFTVVLTMIAAVLFWFDFAFIGLLLVVTAAVPLILEFAMYKKFIDWLPLFKKYPSHNVIATRRAAMEGKPKKRIFLVGHADSQGEWTLNYKLGGVGMKLVLIPAVVGMIVCAVANLLKFILWDLAVLPQEGFLKVLFTIAGIALFVLFPCFVGFLFFQSRTKYVPGANDNMTGCYVAMSVIRDMAARDFRFDDTEVVVMLSGSEEAGLRGAKAYVKAHKAELLDPEVQTVAVGLDTFREVEWLRIYNRDMSGTVGHSPKMQKLFYEAGQACGLDLASASIYIGASDAAAFTQGGIPSTGFAAMDDTPPKYYHTRLDDVDMLMPDGIQLGCDVTLKAVEIFAENGI